MMGGMRLCWVAIPFDDNANMIALQCVSYKSSFDIAGGGNLNTDTFKSFWSK